LQEELERRLGDRRAGELPSALLIVDLSRFKAVNDTLGNLAGDDVLKQAAGRIAGAVAEFTIANQRAVWRLGGNEFALLLPCRDAEDAANRVMVCLRQPFDVSGQEIQIGARIGIAPNIALCHSPSAAIRSCDLALREAKRRLSYPCVVYDASMDEPVLRRHTVEQRLRAAVEADALDIVYQPRVAADDGRILGFEALLRWTDEVLGVVPPVEFIQLAEETRIVVELGARVLQRALEQLAIWHRTLATQPVRISVNVSQIQLSPSFVEVVRTTLTRLDLAPESLELEITETALMEDEGGARDALAQLRAFGVRIALDDFGSGYSSLGMIRQLPIGVLKMDRGFVRDLGEGTDAEAVAAAIVALARVYGFEVVAEGVETPEQRDLLVALGCDELQGFLFSPPLDAEDATRALERGTLQTQKSRSRWTRS
jgi:diguanylate cyclase (GGDEF)-like protein